VNAAAARATTKSLARLARLAGDLERRSALCTDLARLIEVLRGTGVVVEGEARRLAERLGALDEARAGLAELADTGDTREGSRPLERLEALLSDVEWEVAEQAADDLTRKAERQERLLTAYRRRIEDWRGHLRELSRDLHQAQVVSAPVGSERDEFKRLGDLVNRAAQRLDDPREDGLPIEQMEQLDAEAGKLRQLTDQIKQRAAAAARFSRKADLQVLRSPLDQRQRYVYTVLLRTPSEPGTYGVSIEGSSTLAKQDCDLIGATCDSIAAAIGRGSARASGSPASGAAPADPAAPVTETTAIDGGPSAPAGEPETDGTVRRYGSAAPSGELVAPRTAGDQAQDIGDFMCRLVIPEQMQRYLTDVPCSVTITTNDLALPWELMSYRDAAGNLTSLCLEKPVARMPMGRAIPRDGRTTRPPDKFRFLLIYADPHGTLQAARQEIETIEQALKGEWQDRIEVTILDETPESRASGRRLNQELRSGRYNVIHYAGHADFDQDRPELSGLLLHDAGCRVCARAASGGGPRPGEPTDHEDEVFFAQKIRRLLEGRPLVFLNACESGRTANEQAPRQAGAVQEPAEGLASAFIYGGALGCVGSLWPVYDDAAAELAIHFYRQVLQEQTIGEAMRLARQEIRKRYPNQVTWAGFILYGDPTFRLENVLRRES
jgi:hypothetical protein